jgi:hypothetical protein
MCTRVHIFASISGSSFYVAINEIKMIQQMLGPVFFESMVSFLNIVGPCVG